MRWRAKTYPVVISRALDTGRLAMLSPAEADEGEESGFLAGNQMYQDLRALSWADLAATIELEADLMARLQAAADLDPAAEVLDDERLDVNEPADGLWGLDIGVASAVAAFSVLGGAPVSLQRRRVRRNPCGRAPLCCRLSARDRSRRDAKGGRGRRCGRRYG
jgi:hypothetical protein